eukprot:703510-Prymnesium_polylepis.1
MHHIARHEVPWRRVRGSPEWDALPLAYRPVAIFEQCDPVDRRDALDKVEAQLMERVSQMQLERAE